MTPFTSENSASSILSSEKLPAWSIGWWLFCPHPHSDGAAWGFGLSAGAVHRCSRNVCWKSPSAPFHMLHSPKTTTPERTAIHPQDGFRYCRLNKKQPPPVFQLDAWSLCVTTRSCSWGYRRECHSERFPLGFTGPQSHRLAVFQNVSFRNLCNLWFVFP